MKKTKKTAKSEERNEMSLQKLLSNNEIVMKLPELSITPMGSVRDK